MTDSVDMTADLMGAPDARVRRREERRDFFKAAFGVAATAGTIGLAGRASAQTATPTPSPTPSATPTPTPSPTPTLADPDILNYALQLEYLQAQFYAYATTGNGLSASLTGGSGAAGAVTGGRQVAFSDPLIARYASELAADQVAHVTYLRGLIGTTTTAQPAIDISATATGPFSVLARGAGLIGTGGTFDPYESDVNFLLGAYIFQDLVVTAYKGVLPLFTTPANTDAVAGLLATEAYHAATIRSMLYTMGASVPAYRTSADGFSNQRDSLDGPSDLDQGISPTTINNATVSTIVPADAFGITFSRTPQQVLNIVYLSGAGPSKGGFFPAGINGKVTVGNTN